MDIQLIKLIVEIVFFLAVGALAVLSIMAIYVFIRYGRTKSITIITSLVFGGLFLTGVISAYITLQNIF